MRPDPGRPGLRSTDREAECGAFNAHSSSEPAALNPLGGLCGCVAEHSPTAFVPTYHHILPQSWGGPSVPENMVWLCPNAHTATHRLIDDYVRAGGDPGWDVRQHFSPFVRGLALRAWEQRPTDPGITSVSHP